MAISIGDVMMKIGLDTADFDKSMQEVGNKIEQSLKGMQTQLRIAGTAFIALGAAGLKMVDSAREMNAQLGATGITIGKTVNEMRDLALSVTDVTFPLKSVISTFDLLARAGVRDTEQLQASAKAFDALADATGSSAEVVADTLIPSFKVFGLELPKSADEMDKFTWLTKNTTVDLSDFGSAMTWVAREGSKLGITIDDMVAIMAALESRGITGAAAIRTFRTAVTEAASTGKSLNDVLGITQTQVDGYKTKISDASGITKTYSDQLNTQHGLMDQLMQTIGELTLRFGSFLEPFEPIMAFFTALGPLLIFASTSWGAHALAVVASKVALIAHTVVTRAATIAQWALNAALSANPFGLIVLALGIVATGLLTYFGLTKKAKTSTDELNTSIVQVAKTTGDWASELARLNDVIKDSDLRLTTLQELLDPYLDKTDRVITMTAAEVDAEGKLSDAIDGVVDATLGSTVANNAYADTLLKKRSLTESDVNWLKIYIDRVKTATAEDKRRQAVLQAYSDFKNKMQELTDAQIDSRTEAGKLGVTLDILAKYLIAQGTTVDQLMDAYDRYGIDVNAWASGLKVDLREVAAFSQRNTDSMVADVKDLTEAAKDAARDRVEVEKDAIDKRITAQGKAHDSAMQALDDEYNATVQLIDAKLGLTLKGYQSQIDVIDAQIDAQDKADKDRLNTAKIASLQEQILRETDSYKKQELQAELENLYLELAKEKNRQVLEDQKDTIRQSMDATREQAQNAKDQEQESYNFRKRLAEQTYTDLIVSLQAEKTALDTALTETLKRYDDDLAAFEKLQKDELGMTAKFVEEYNKLIAELKDKVVTVTTVYTTSGAPVSGAADGGGAVPPAVPGAPIPTPLAPVLPSWTGTGIWGPVGYVPGFQHGGIIPEPTLLSSLRTGRPYAIAAETRPERVSPMGEGYRTANIYLQLDGRTIAQVIGQPLVEIIRLRQGLRI